MSWMSELDLRISELLAEGKTTDEATEQAISELRQESMCRETDACLCMSCHARKYGEKDEL